jgi:hypothetical protein
MGWLTDDFHVGIVDPLVFMSETLLATLYGNSLLSSLFLNLMVLLEWGTVRCGMMHATMTCLDILFWLLLVVTKGIHTRPVLGQFLNHDLYQGLHVF